jgi:guanine deaminase
MGIAELHERLFAMQILGDDRAVAATWLRGRRAYSRAD